MTQSCRSLLTDRWQVTDRVMYQFQVLNVTKSSRSVRFVLLCIKIHQLFAIFECALNKVCMLNLNLINSWDQEGCNITNDLPEFCKSCCCHESLVSQWPPPNNTWQCIENIWDEILKMKIFQLDKTGQAGLGGNKATAAAGWHIIDHWMRHNKQGRPLALNGKLINKNTHYCKS